MRPKRFRVVCLLLVIVMKRVLRYLAGHRRLVFKFEWQAKPEGIVAYLESDSAGCAIPRRSTSGGILQHGKHVIHHWSKTQRVVACSSGEAELNAVLKGSAEVSLMTGLLRELGVEKASVVYIYIYIYYILYI